MGANQSCGFTDNLLECKYRKVGSRWLKKHTNLDFNHYPTPQQESLLRITLGWIHLVVNKALAARTQAWYEQQERVGNKQTSAMLM